MTAREKWEALRRELRQDRTEAQRLADRVAGERDAERQQAKSDAISLVLAKMAEIDNIAEASK